jgi:hypothetical protein
MNRLGKKSEKYGEKRNLDTPSIKNVRRKLFADTEDVQAKPHFPNFEYLKLTNASSMLVRNNNEFGFNVEITIEIFINEIETFIFYLSNPCVTGYNIADVLQTCDKILEFTKSQISISNNVREKLITLCIKIRDLCDIITNILGTNV